MNSCTLKAQKDRKAGMTCELRWPGRARGVEFDAPERSPLWVWIGAVGADLVLEVLSPYEPLKSFLCGCLVHVVEDWMEN